MDIRKHINLLLEDHKLDFGCVMLFFDFPKINKFHNQIDSNDLYIDKEDPSFGLETEPHCTLLWGLHDNITTEDVKNNISLELINQYYLGYNVSLFDTNPNYDVLKLDVREYRGNNLSKTNQSLSSLSHEPSEFGFNPHLTIAYLKKGAGQKYLEKFKGNQFDLQPSYIGYSKTDGSLDKIEI